MDTRKRDGYENWRQSCMRMMHFSPCQTLLSRRGTPGSKKHTGFCFLSLCCPTGWQLHWAVDLDVTKVSKPEKRTNKQHLFILLPQCQTIYLQILKSSCKFQNWILSWPRWLTNLSLTSFILFQAPVVANNDIKILKKGVKSNKQWSDLSKINNKLSLTCKKVLIRRFESCGYWW